MAKETTTTTPAVAAGLALLESPVLAEAKVNLKLLRQVILGLQANQHRSTANTLKRGEVRGGGKKPWRQKGTGRARVGSSRNPVWRGGGIAFGPSTAKNYQQTLTPRMKAAAMLSALALKQNKGQLLVGDIKADLTKTKDAVKALADVRATVDSLIVVPEVSMRRSLQNLPGVTVTTVTHLNPLDITSARTVIFLNKSFDQLKTKLQK